MDWDLHCALDCNNRSCILEDLVGGNEHMRLLFMILACWFVPPTTNLLCVCCPDAIFQLSFTFPEDSPAPLFPIPFTVFVADGEYPMLEENILVEDDIAILVAICCAFALYAASCC